MASRVASGSLVENRFTVRERVTPAALDVTLMKLSLPDLRSSVRQSVLSIAIRLHSQWIIWIRRLGLPLALESPRWGYGGVFY